MMCSASAVWAGELTDKGASLVHAPLPEAVASFGAAGSDGWIYVYGGHVGTAHEHSADNLSSTFCRAPLAGGEWERLPMDRPLQGLGVVAHSGKIYRVGGLSAKNSAGEDPDLYSVADVVRFDVERGKWEQMPPLPMPRSSHDAVVLDGKFYVVGGWNLQGDAEPIWHTTAHVLDLKAQAPSWQTFEQPFKVRALALAAAAGKLHVVGGMNADAEPTTGVEIYDLKSETWSAGPPLPGEPKNGFGAAAIGIGSDLYATTLDGKLWRLDSANKKWQASGELQTPRFFHRLQAGDDATVLAIGGAAFGAGHLRDVETVSLRDKEQ